VPYSVSDARNIANLIHRYSGSWDYSVRIWARNAADDDATCVEDHDRGAHDLPGSSRGVRTGRKANGRNASGQSSWRCCSMLTYDDWCGCSHIIVCGLFAVQVNRTGI